MGKSALYTGQTTTKQGFELTFGTNYLGTFLLTYLLIDLLKRSAPCQVINLTSCMHYWLWKKMVLKNGKINVDAYNGSKLGNVMHARELGKRFKGNMYVKCIWW